MVGAETVRLTVQDALKITSYGSRASVRAFWPKDSEFDQDIWVDEDNYASHSAILTIFRASC